MYISKLKNNNLKLNFSNFSLKNEKRNPVLNNVDNFSSYLNQEKNKNLKEEIQNYLNILDYSSQQFIENINFENLKKYKLNIKKILEHILKFNYHLKSYMGIKIDYKVLHVINEKLHELAIWVLKKEKSKIILINQINGIKGLIIDILS